MTLDKAREMAIEATLGFESGLDSATLTLTRTVMR